MAARQSRAKRAPPSQQDSEPPVFISLDPPSSTGQLSGLTHSREAARSQRVPEVLEQAQPAEAAAHSPHEAAQQSSKVGAAKDSAPEVIATAAEQTGIESEPAAEAFDAGAMRASLRDIYLDMVNEGQPTSSAGSQKAAEQRERAVNGASERSGTGSEAQQDFSQHRSMRSRSSSSRAGPQAGKQRSAVPEQSRARTQHTATLESASDASQFRSRSSRERAPLYGTSVDAEPRPEQHPKRERDRKRIEELRTERREVSAAHHLCPETIALAFCVLLQDSCMVSGQAVGRLLSICGWCT